MTTLTGTHAGVLAPRVPHASAGVRLSRSPPTKVTTLKTTTATVQQLLNKEVQSPISLAVIPNYMGINLCSVEALSWTRQDDGQLVSMTIHFDPERK